MNLSMEFTLLVWILSLIFNLGLCSPSFIKSVVIQNLMCPSASIDFGHLRSGLQCAQKCYNNVDCQGFFYKPSGMCLGTTFNISSPTGCLLETGTKYYYSTEVKETPTTEVPTTPVVPTTTVLPTVPTAPAPLTCFSDIDCTQPNQFCYNLWCTCKPGYSLTPLTLSCTDSCTVYGPTYLYYMYQVLDDPSGVLFLSVSVFQCELQCINRGCRSFSYNYVNSRCKISNNTALTLPTGYMAHSQIDYYNRNCA